MARFLDLIQNYAHDVRQALRCVLSFAQYIICASAPQVHTVKMSVDQIRKIIHPIDPIPVHASTAPDARNVRCEPG